MCGRASITKTEKQVEDRFGAVFVKNTDGSSPYSTNTNICPSQTIAVITNSSPQSIMMYRWGLIPPWAPDINIGFKTFNARKETLLDRPAFKTAIHTSRCLVLMDGFYEWTLHNGKKLPFRISTDDHSLFAVAGLWAVWQHPSDGTLIHSCTVITQEPNTFMSSIHDRMPAILSPSQEQQWIDNSLTAQDALQLLLPSDDLPLVSEQVDPATGKADDSPTQLSLF